MRSSRRPSPTPGSPRPRSRSFATAASFSPRPMAPPRRRSGPRAPTSPYQIASNSKQFTAMALLLLEDEGKLSLDDKVAKWVPGISGGDRIALRQLLSHTAGLQDYWPQDYSFAAMNRPVAPQGIVDRWAKKPLDYAPGTRWQYSNTGYVIAGLVAEKAAGEPLMTYLQRRVFAPLGMRPVNIDDSNGPAFPAGYHALRARPGAPRHPAGARLALRRGRIVDDRDRPRQVEHRPARSQPPPRRRLGGAGSRRHASPTAAPPATASACRAASPMAAASSTTAAPRSASCRRTPSIPTTARRSSC